MDDVRWEAPGAGRWDLDLSHCLGSMTPLMQHVHGSGMRSGMRELFETYGMPLDTIDARFVNGYFYSRLRPLISPDKVSAKAPPAIVLKVAFKLHPELRRRSKQAEATLADKPWRAAIREWESTERATFERENLALQDVDLAALDTDGLAAHYEAVLGALLRGYHRHFVLHGYDLGPIGLLLVEARRLEPGRPTRSCRRSRVRPRARPSRPASWAASAPRWPRAAPRRPRSTTCGPSRPRRPPSSTSTSATAARWCSAATTSTASRWASCPTSCSPRSWRAGTRPAPTTPRPWPPSCGRVCPTPTGPSSTTCSPRPGSP